MLEGDVLRRVKNYTLDAQCLFDLLDSLRQGKGVRLECWPEGSALVSMHYDPFTEKLIVRVAHPSFPFVRPGNVLEEGRLLVTDEKADGAAEVRRQLADIKEALVKLSLAPP